MRLNNEGTRRMSESGPLIYLHGKVIEEYTGSSILHARSAV